MGLISRKDAQSNRVLLARLSHLKRRLSCDRMHNPHQKTTAWTRHRHLQSQKHKIGKVVRNLAMSVVVPDGILAATRMTKAELPQETAYLSP